MFGLNVFGQYNRPMDEADGSQRYAGQAITDPETGATSYVQADGSMGASPPAPASALPSYGGAGDWSKYFSQANDFGRTGFYGTPGSVGKMLADAARRAGVPEYDFNAAAAKAAPGYGWALPGASGWLLGANEEQIYRQILQNADDPRLQALANERSPESIATGARAGVERDANLARENAAKDNGTSDLTKLAMLAAIIYSGGSAAGLFGGLEAGAGAAGGAFGATEGLGMAGSFNALSAGAVPLTTAGAAGTNALLASSSPTLSGMGAAGAYVPNVGIAGVNAALGLGGGGAAGAGIDTAALNLGAAGTNAAIDAVGAAGTGAAASSLPSWMNAIKPYTSLIGGALSAGGALLGAGQISSAARDAAALSSGAANNATALQRQMYEQNQANLAPYLAAGTNALGRISTGLAPGGEFSKSFSMDDFTADPGYGFRMSEGLKAMDRNAAARGGLISGAALKAGARYGQDMASQEYTNAFNRYQTNRCNQLQPLQSLAGIGQTATNNLASVGSNYASNVGNIGTNAANTQANAGLTSSQAYASAYGAAGNALNNAFNPNPVMAYLQSLNKQGNYNG